MRPQDKFLNKPKSFWAAVKTISQETGYTVRGHGLIKVPTVDDIVSAFRALGLQADEVLHNGGPTEFTNELIEYFLYRANILNNFVEPRLMDVERASAEYNNLIHRLAPRCPLPFNKQKGEMRSPAYFTCMINMLIEAAGEDVPCVYDPKKLTTITSNGMPLRTLSRRVDGSFPDTINPIAIWEIKEYYYTTTFGSRVADGVYETLLDGMELEELYTNENKKVLHYLMLDAHYTWWSCGKSYLCRIIDLLNMGYVDEVLFGYEVIERLPDIVAYWVELFRGRNR